MRNPKSDARKALLKELVGEMRSTQARFVHAKLNPKPKAAEPSQAPSEPDAASLAALKAHYESQN